MRKISSFITGGILGGLLGSLLIVFIAPSSGKEMRDQLRANFKSLIDELQSAGEQRRQELENELAKLRSGEE